MPRDLLAPLLPSRQPVTPQPIAPAQPDVNPIPRATGPRDLLAKGQNPVAPVAKGERWRTGDIAPIERNLDTGEWRWAIPNMIHGIMDAVALPGEVMRGEVDPNSAEGFDRTMNLAMMGVSPLRGTGKVTGKVGEVVKEVSEPLPAGVKAGLETPSKLEINRAPAPVEVQPKNLAASAVDQELDAMLNQLLNPEKQTIRSKATIGEDKPKGFPKSTVTGTMGGKEVTGTANISGKIMGNLDVTATLGERAIDLKLTQAKRVMSAAKQAEKAAKEGEIKNFATKGYSEQMELAYLLTGKTPNAGVKSVVDGSRNAVAALEDPAKVAKFVEDTAAIKDTPAKISFGDRVFEVWVNALLSGPQTHAVNMLSNSLVNVWGLGEQGVTAALSKVTGSGVTFREVGHRVLGDIEAVGDALRASGAAFQTEKDLFDIGKLENRTQIASIPGPIGRAVRIPGRALTAEDAFFKTLAYRQEIDGLAVRNAYGEGLSGRRLAERIVELKNNPSEDMMAKAQQFSRRQTFTNELGDTGKAAQTLLSKNKGLRFILPFFRTPVNLLKYSAERTPVGLLLRQTRQELMGSHGAVARDQAMAKMTMGSAIAGYVFYQAAQGNITGNGPSNDNERKLWLANGNQPYSVKVGDTWYSYSRLEPLGTIFGIAADMQTLKNEASDQDASDIAALVTASVSRNLTSKTWLRGPVEFAQMLNDTDRYGEPYASRMLGTIVPTGVAQYARTQDPYLRETELLLDGIKDRVPGYRETLAIRRDVFGEPIKSEGGLGPDLFSPIYTRQARSDPTMAEMLRLELYPGRLEKKIGGVDLLPEEWDYYSAASGQTVKRYMDAVVKHPDFKELPDGIRRSLLEDSMRKARDAARIVTQTKFPDLMLRMAQQKAQKQLVGQPVATSP